MKIQVILSVIVATIAALFSSAAFAKNIKDRTIDCNSPNAPTVQEEIDKAIGPTVIQISGKCAGFVILKNGIVIDGDPNALPSPGGVATVTGPVSVGSSSAEFRNVTFENSVTVSDNAFLRLADNILNDGLELRNGAVARLSGNNSLSGSPAIVVSKSSSLVGGGDTHVAGTVQVFRMSFIEFAQNLDIMGQVEIGQQSEMDVGDFSGEATSNVVIDGNVIIAQDSYLAVSSSGQPGDVVQIIGDLDCQDAESSLSFPPGFLSVTGTNNCSAFD